MLLGGYLRRVVRHEIVDVIGEERQFWMTDCSMQEKVYEVVVGKCCKIDAFLIDLVS